MRHYSWLDRLLIEVDHAARVCAGACSHRRASPGDAMPSDALDACEKKQSAQLMRVNHCGEVCAQALYCGQAWSAKDEQTRAWLHHAAEEEIDHLIWCRKRLKQLGSTTSFCDPFFYVCSFALGALTGRLGDAISLGFVAETEHQVGKHLQSHLTHLPSADHVSRAIVQQMQQDEALHERSAEAAGAHALPPWVCGLMTLWARVMTGTTKWF